MTNDFVCDIIKLSNQTKGVMLMKTQREIEIENIYEKSIWDMSMKEIIDNGKMLSVDESCLPSKIYLGHIKALLGKCDYILVEIRFQFVAFRRQQVSHGACFDAFDSLGQAINVNAVSDMNISEHII